MLHLSWFTLTIALGIILLGLGILSYCVNYSKCLSRLLKEAYLNFRYDFVLKWVPEKSLLLALDYFISNYYGHSPAFKTATVMQAVTMIVAAYLPDKNISPKELQEITEYLLNKKFKLSKMFSKDISLDIPVTEKEVVDKIIPIAETLKNVTDMPLGSIKDILRTEIPELDYINSNRIKDLIKKYKVTL